MCLKILKKFSWLFIYLLIGLGYLSYSFVVSIIIYLLCDYDICRSRPSNTSFNIQKPDQAICL